MKIIKIKLGEDIINIFGDLRPLALILGMQLGVRNVQDLIAVEDTMRIIGRERVKKACTVDWVGGHEFSPNTPDPKWEKYDAQLITDSFERLASEFTRAYQVWYGRQPTDRERSLMLKCAERIGGDHLRIALQEPFLTRMARETLPEDLHLFSEPLFS